MTCAPVTLFVYNRLDHTRRTIEALRTNELANESDLIVYSDAPRSAAQAENVREVRKYIREIKGFKSLTVIERETNFGLARSIIDGVTTILNKHDRIIVLEDDMVTSPYFLTYMNEALEKYADDERVVCIHGYLPPINQPLPETFFLLGADCWGWSTWRRGWAWFNSDGQALLNELKLRKLTYAFDYNGAHPFTRMLKGQVKGRNESWAVRWHASAFLRGKLTLHPGRSLVHNIGNDDSGTHCGETASMDVILSPTPVNLVSMTVEPSEKAGKAFEDFYRQLQLGWPRRVVRKVKMMLWKIGKVLR